MIGKIERVTLREVWPHEARDFTVWLQENIDVLNEVLEVPVSAAEREQSAGDFSVDLLAEDADGRPVVIENQLEVSDHDHLGKLVTYLAAFEAKTVVWIVANPRPEHVKAVSWLNEATDVMFYLVKVEAIRIGDSRAAPLLTRIVGPSEVSRQVGDTKRELAERHKIRHRFWTQLLERAGNRTTLHASISPSTGNWVSTGAGKSGLSLSYVVRMHDARVELYIDRGGNADGENEAIFDQLEASREQIEEAFGGPLSWERLEGKRACRIACRVEVGGWKDEDRWAEVHEAMIEAMIRLEGALRPYIDRIRV